MKRLAEILGDVKEEAPLIEKRIGKIFVLAELLNLTPVELMLTAYHMMAFGASKAGAPPSKSSELMATIAAALQELISNNISLDPVNWARKEVLTAVTSNRVPGVILTEVDPVSKAAFAPFKSGWDEPVVEK